MERLYPNLILDALKNVRYPGNGKNIVELDMIEDDIRIDGNKVSFSIIFEKPTDPFIKSIVKAAETAILTYISPEVDIIARFPKVLHGRNYFVRVNAGGFHSVIGFVCL